MYCNKCGAKNPDDARFCSSCGAPLHSSSAVRTGQGEEGYDLDDMARDDSGGEKSFQDLFTKKEEKRVTMDHVAVNTDFVQTARQKSDSLGFAVLCIFFGAASIMMGFTTGMAIPFLIPAAAIVFGIIAQRKAYWKSIAAWVGLALSAAGIVIQVLTLMG